jgi:hypothetical protein
MPDTMTLINSYTVVGTSTSTIDFTNIPNTYSDLFIKFSPRHTTAGGEDTPYVRFNGDSASNYYFVFGSGRGGVPTASGQNPGTSLWCGTVPGAGDTAGAFSNIEVYVPNYASTTLKKAMRFEGMTSGMTGSMYQRTGGGYWGATAAAINRVTLGIVSGSYNFAAGTTAYIYGIKNS